MGKIRKFKKQSKQALIFFLSSVVFIFGVTYLTYRWIFTLNLLTSPFTTFWSYALLIAEILTLAVFTNFSLILVKTGGLKRVVPDNYLQNDYYKDVFKDRKIVTFDNFCPSADVFICTLNESVDILASTICACANIDYPNKNVFVLDDGRREEVRELANLLGVNYITRFTNEGFKAGNINNALSLTHSDIVVIFDADHIPAASFLRETVYNFVDENVALVQTPQHFGNPDAFQKNLKMEKFLSNEQDMFYRVIEPGLNAFDAVFCGGTNILLRRSHLSSIGNFPDTTITEDSLLGLMLHAQGYDVIYYNRPLAIGIAASTFREYIGQRARWAKGNVQIVTNPKNWKYYAKLKPVQAFFYLSGVLYFFTPIARLVFLLAPVLFLFFDISPVLALFYQIFAFQICYFGLKFMFIFTHILRVRNVIMADVYDLLTSIFTIGGILRALFIPDKLWKIKFNVTKKGVKADYSKYKYITVCLFILILLLLAQAQGIYDLKYSNPYSDLAVVANLFWNGVNIIVMFFALQVVWEKPEKRIYQRVRTSVNVEVEDEFRRKYLCNIYDVSRSGVSFVCPPELEKDLGRDLVMDMQGFEEKIKLLYMRQIGDKFIYKSIFKKPIALFRLTRQKVQKLNEFIKRAYKDPDFWDEYFDKK